MVKHHALFSGGGQFPPVKGGLGGLNIPCRVILLWGMAAGLIYI